MRKHREVRGIDVAMSEREIEELLLSQPLMRIATASEKAEPHVAPLWYVYLDGCIYFSSDEKTRKMRNIKRNHRVSLVIDSGHGLFDIKGVMINGEASVVEDRDLVQKLRTLFAEKYFGSVDNPEFDRLDFYMRKQVFVKIEPLEIISWDYGKWDKK
jgi:nitroimidazol reductase NimA-like FMN-containing flavoprotein (pyridoxamine 5'-phosphate oxidase superfamily)